MQLQRKYLLPQQDITVKELTYIVAHIVRPIVIPQEEWDKLPPQVKRHLADEAP